MIGRAELRATLLERASSLMQGFEGGLLVLQVCPIPLSSAFRVFLVGAAARVLKQYL